jgi:hypothetical protein
MFWTDREHVVTALRAIAAKVCAYGGSGRCDCKYARGDTKNLLTATEAGNGCCELSAAAEAIEHMTDREWEMVKKRSRLAMVKVVKKIEAKPAIVAKLMREKGIEPA